MDNNTLLITTFFSILMILVIGLYWRKRTREIHKEKLKSQWESYLKAWQRKDISGIKNYGFELVYNTHLTKEQLEQLDENISSLKRQELQELETAIMNKKLHYRRGLPW